MLRISCLVAVVLALFVLPPAQAHHRNVIFDLASVVTLRGTVPPFEWRNPHVYIYVESPDDRGTAVEWLVEADPTPRTRDCTRYDSAHGAWGPPKGTRQGLVAAVGV